MVGTNIINFIEVGASEKKGVQKLTPFRTIKGENMFELYSVIPVLSNVIYNETGDVGVLKTW